MQKGYLIFELKKYNGAQPVTDAQVKIISIDGREVNKILNVDKDGKTEEYEIYTKNSNLTFDRMNKEIPYTKVDAEIKFEKDKLISVAGIPVYSNIKSIQEINLNNENNYKINHKDKKNRLKREHIYFKNQSPCVYEDVEVVNEDESIIKPIAGIKEMYIPEFISVHIGSLHDKGEILSVPFVDYVKNVTCASIYPTWKNEAIKANIYSIISFSLNRIYTNWYKSKGYGFEITNDCNYDQKYVKGQTLFKNICDLVDEIFNECVRIKGFKQPLLCKCVNNSKEKNLSRWGSLDLAEEGNSSLDILRKYYGENIEIIKINNIEGILNNFTRQLCLGDRGEDVRLLQKHLNFIGKKYEGITPLDEDGIFGENTEKAVKDFQRIFNLKIDGIVGENTWNKLFILYSLSKRMFYDGVEVEEKFIKFQDCENVVNEENNRDECENAEDSYKKPNTLMSLKIGDEGEHVKKLQQNLNNLSVYYGFLEKLLEDGIFGEHTEKVLKKFQRKFGLYEDGIAGEETLNKISCLNTALEELGENNVNLNKLNYDNKRDDSIENLKFKSEYSMKYPEFDMEIGCISGYVLLAQKYINKIKGSFENYFQNKELLLEDGKFGSNTLKDIRDFKNKFGLNNEDKIDRYTWNKLVIEYEKLC